jgi:hypothetical protein
MVTGGLGRWQWLSEAADTVVPGRPRRRLRYIRSELSMQTLAPAHRLERTHRDLMTRCALAHSPAGRNTARLEPSAINPASLIFNSGAFATVRLHTLSFRKIWCNWPLMVPALIVFFAHPRC